MFDFLKPKPKPAKLFTMRVSLDPYYRQVLDQGIQLFNIRKDGTALSAGKLAGKISGPVWKYITYFGLPTTMRRISYNLFETDVYGSADMSLVFEDPHDRPYIYRCGTIPEYPPMLPGTEYHCTLEPEGEDLAILVAGNRIGKVVNNREGRIDRIKGMLHKGYQATAQIDPDNNRCALYLVVRKV